MPSPRTEPPASYSVAFGTVLFAVSVPFLLWGATALLTFSPYEGSMFDVAELFALLTFGSVLLFFSLGGALSVVLRDVRAERDGDDGTANASAAPDAG